MRRRQRCNRLGGGAGIDNYDQAAFILLDVQFHEVLFTAVGMPEIWSMPGRGKLARVRFLQSKTRGVTLPLTQHQALIKPLPKAW